MTSRRSQPCHTFIRHPHPIFLFHHIPFLSIFFLLLLSNTILPVVGTEKYHISSVSRSVVFNTSLSLTTQNVSTILHSGEFGSLQKAKAIAINMTILVEVITKGGGTERVTIQWHPPKTSEDDAASSLASMVVDNSRLDLIDSSTTPRQTRSSEAGDVVETFEVSLENIGAHLPESVTNSAAVAELFNSSSSTNIITVNVTFGTSGHGEQQLPSSFSINVLNASLNTGIVPPNFVKVLPDGATHTLFSSMITACSNIGMQLAAITDYEEHLYIIHHILEPLGTNQRYFTGAFSNGNTGCQFCYLYAEGFQYPCTPSAPRNDNAFVWPPDRSCQTDGDNRFLSFNMMYYHNTTNWTWLEVESSAAVANGAICQNNSKTTARMSGWMPFELSTLGVHQTQSLTASAVPTGSTSASVPPTPSRTASLQSTPTFGTTPTIAVARGQTNTASMAATRSSSTTADMSPSTSFSLTASRSLLAATDPTQTKSPTPSVANIATPTNTLGRVGKSKSETSSTSPTAVIDRLPSPNRRSSTRTPSASTAVLRSNTLPIVQPTAPPPATTTPAPLTSQPSASPTTGDASTNPSTQRDDTTPPPTTTVVPEPTNATSTPSPTNATTPDPGLNVELEQQRADPPTPQAVITTTASMQVVSSALASGLGTPTVAAQAMRAAPLLTLSKCQYNHYEAVEPATLSWGIEWPLGPETGQYFRGCAAVNAMLLVGCVVLHLFVALVVGAVLTRKESSTTTPMFQRGLEAVRCPSLLIVPFMLFAPSLLSCSTAAAVHGGVTEGDIAILVGTVLGVLMVMLVLYVRVLRPMALHVVFCPVPTDVLTDNTNKRLMFFVGDGQWRDIMKVKQGHPGSSGDAFCKRFGLFFSEHSDRFPFFILVEAISVFVSSVLGGIRPSASTDCAILLGLLMAINLGFVAAILVWKPFNSLFGTVESSAAGVLTATAAACALAANVLVDSENKNNASSNSLVRAADYLVLVVSLLGFIKMIVDVVLRRHRANMEVLNPAQLVADVPDTAADREQQSAAIGAKQQQSDGATHESQDLLVPLLGAQEAPCAVVPARSKSPNTATAAEDSDDVIFDANESEESILDDTKQERGDPTASDSDSGAHLHHDSKHFQRPEDDIDLDAFLYPTQPLPTTQPTSSRTRAAVTTHNVDNPAAMPPRRKLTRDRRVSTHISKEHQDPFRTTTTINALAADSYTKNYLLAGGHDDGDVNIFGSVAQPPPPPPPSSSLHHATVAVPFGMSGSASGRSTPDDEKFL